MVDTTSPSTSTSITSADIFGVSTEVLEANSVKKVNDDILSAVLEAIGEGQKADERFLKDNYSYLKEHIEAIDNDIRETLEFYFPGRWEIQDTLKMSISTEDSLKTWINKIKFTDIEDQSSFMSQLVRCVGYNNYHSASRKLLLIHFPEIEIKNSRSEKHKIKNLWMKFEFNFVYRMMRMGGTRSTKTFSEHESYYNHSHIECTQNARPNEFLSCCLGGTDYSTLYAALHGQYDKNNMTLFLQQLQDYLGWESLEGGPHMRMEGIGDRNYRGSTRNSPSGNDLINAYKSFLRTFPSGYNIELSDNGINYKFKIIKDEEFKAKVAQVCPEQFKMLYDTIQKRQYIENHSTSNNSARIQELNRNYSLTKLFDFKGQAIYFQIEDPNATMVQVEQPHIVKMAPENMINYVAQQLELNINNFYSNKFVQEFLRQ